MEKIAQEIQAWKEENVTGIPAPHASSNQLLTCEQACWKASAFEAADLVSESQIEGLSRWATSGEAKSLQRVRILFHSLGVPSPFSPPQKK